MLHLFSIYHHQSWSSCLTRWIHLFLEQNPDRTLKEVYTLLELNSNLQPDIDHSINFDNHPTGILEAYITKTDDEKEYLRLLFELEKSLTPAKRSLILEKLERLKLQNTPKSPTDILEEKRLHDELLEELNFLKMVDKEHFNFSAHFDKSHLASLSSQGVKLLEASFLKHQKEIRSICQQHSGQDEAFVVQWQLLPIKDIKKAPH